MFPKSETVKALHKGQTSSSKGFVPPKTKMAVRSAENKATYTFYIYTQEVRILMVV